MQHLQSVLGHEDVSIDANQDDGHDGLFEGREVVLWPSKVCES